MSAQYPSMTIRKPIRGMSLVGVAFVLVTGDRGVPGLGEGVEGHRHG